MYKGKYKVIGSELSMFTRKLEAQLRYQKIPHEWEFKTFEKSQDFEQRAGTRFIPLLETPDGWIVNDTISIGPMLSERFTEEAVIPSTPKQRAMCYILEDYFNHWMPRHALHSRWCYDDNVVVAGKNFGSNLMLGKSVDEKRTAEEEEQVAGVGPMMRDSFGLGACEVQGAGPDKKDEMQADYQAMMNALAQHFQQHDFLLGGRACLADFALVGPAVAHFLIDPEPKSWLGENEAMLQAYVDRIWEGSKGGDYLANDEIPEALNALIDHMKNNYQKFALASIEAAGQGEKFFTLDLGRGEFTGRSMRRLDKARLHVQDEILRAGADKSDLVDRGILEMYLKPAIV